MAEKKTTKKKTLGVEEAAEFVGLSVEDLLRSRGRGLAPGSLGYKKDGALVWNQTDLTKAESPSAESEAQEVEEGNGDE